MAKFKAFLKKNIIWCCIGCAIYWGVPYIIVTFLGIFVNKWFFTIYLAVFTTQVALPAIPIIIGISLGAKIIFKGKIKMLGVFQSKIDRLTKRKANLGLKRLKVQDKAEEVNSSIETELKKLENLSWRNKQEANRQIEEIDREISKIDQLIDVEKEYVNRINESNNKNK